MRISDFSLVTLLVVFCGQAFAADLPRRDGASDEVHLVAVNEVIPFVKKLSEDLK